MRKILIPFVVVLAVVTYQAVFVVQEINQAIVLQFGDPKKIVNKSGLNLSKPSILQLSNELSKLIVLAFSIESIKFDNDNSPHPSRFSIIFFCFFKII